MPYIVCTKCNGYYKLQEWESIDDFEECECGGSLIQVDSLNIPYNTERVKTIVETFKKTEPDEKNTDSNGNKLSISIDHTDGLTKLLKNKKSSKKGFSVDEQRAIFKEIALIPELYDFEYIGPIDDHTKLQIIKILAKVVNEGKGVIDATNEIKSKTSLNYEDAENISKNEISRIRNLGNWRIHKEKGYKYFKISKSLNTCKKCRKAYDKKIFSINEVKMLPPLHHLCRCNAIFIK
ncbi:minor capsid protein [Methanobacterium sp.]|uniref:minor capsid protein n=1 Tax=Methanobacterium sp. TaxID=2164 RepID=UPI003C70CC38